MTGLQLSIFNRLKLVKITVIVGMISSMLCSYQLWAGNRSFPVCPFYSDWYLPIPYDYVLFFTVITCSLLLLFITQTRWFIFIILLLNLALVLLDQNRMQPWFFMYNSILAVLFFYNWRIDNVNNYNSFFIVLQLAVCAIYVYSGIQKINEGFMNEAFPELIKPMGKFFSERQMHILNKTGHVLPFYELFIGITLLIRPVRFIAIPMTILLHLCGIFLLGPWGNNYYPGIWPWNLSMILLVLLLFSGKTTERFFSVSNLFKLPVFYYVLVFLWILPSLNLFNKWETNLSLTFYSGNNHEGKIVLSKEAYKKLPLFIRHFAVSENEAYVLYPEKWCLQELKAPLYPEKRIYEKITEEIGNLTGSNNSNVKLVYIEKQKLFDSRH